jgi:protein-L-isoaspartate(D-aspartate) O-methyltransferase
MVRDQIERRGVRDPGVLDAMTRVPRHLFVPEALRGRAYEDGPLPIGHGQTISQPYIVAFMTEAIRPQPTDRVLEIGTGSGYQAAVLALVAREVISIEILPELGESARSRLRELGYDNVTVRIGDGYAGHPDEAPFDAILVTAAPVEVPPVLLEQLKVGGRMVIPVGDKEQHLLRLTRTREGFERENLLPVRFVPMTGGMKPSD